MRSLCCLLLSAITGSAIQAQTERFVLDTKESKRVACTMTYTVKAANFQAREWVVFVATAPELPGQVGVRSSLSPRGVSARERSPLARPILVSRVPGVGLQRTTISLQANYEAILRSRQLRRLAPGERPPVVAPLSASARRDALASLGDIDHADSGFRTWLRDRGFVRKAGEGDLGFAMRVFQNLRRASKYEYRDGMDRKASSVCRSLQSDCGGLAILFVATMRASKIPARTLFGRWALSAKSGETVGGVDYYQWHVKAEFFAEGVGWVPVDLSSGVLHDRTPGGLRYFGQDPGDFITFHVDPNLSLNTVHFGIQKVHNLQTPAFWVTGGGNLSSRTNQEGWTVRVLR